MEQIKMNSHGHTDGIATLPVTFETRDIEVNGAKIHVRIGGQGPVVLMLHGFGTTGDMWAPMAAALSKDYKVIIPDLRGLGLSSKTDDGYAKVNQAKDLSGVLETLGARKIHLVTHDIGNMVGYAFAAQEPERVLSFVPIDAPLPGVEPWGEIQKDPSMWQFGFGGPDMERLVDGRERIYLDRFWNEFSADPKNFDEASREHYAAVYAQPGAMHAGFEQFKAFDQDAIDNKAFVANGKLAMPVLAVGGEKSFGPMMATVMRAAANNVTEAIVPSSGHWVMEENPNATIKLTTDFLAD
jgi:pimeloyl-ACP methyl ester carboxylesterase